MLTFFSFIFILIEQDFSFPYQRVFHFFYLYCRFNYTSQISQIVTEIHQIVCFKPDHEENFEQYL